MTDLSERKTEFGGERGEYHANTELLFHEIRFGVNGEEYEFLKTLSFKREQ